MIDDFTRLVRATPAGYSRGGTRVTIRIWGLKPILWLFELAPFIRASLLRLGLALGWSNIAPACDGEVILSDCFSTNTLEMFPTLYQNNATITELLDSTRVVADDQK